MFIYNYIHFLKGTVWFILLALLSINIYSQELKKVIILKFVNLEKNPNIQYLENSMTQAIDKRLSSMFMYEQADMKSIYQFAEENYLFQDDFGTRSVALNLGLLTKQDVVISGAFYVNKNHSPEILVTDIKIIDVSTKKMISNFIMESKLDGTLFDSIDQIATKVATEVQILLPSKDDWKKGEYNEVKAPFFGTKSLQIGIGYGIFSLDYKNDLTINPPVIQAGVKSTIPKLSNNFNTLFQLIYYSESTNTSSNLLLTDLIIKVDTISPALYFGYQPNFDFLNLNMRLGGGYQFQVISISGKRSENYTNSFPFAGAGLDFSFPITKSIRWLLIFDSLLQFESSKMTLANIISLGTEFEF